MAIFIATGNLNDNTLCFNRFLSFLISNIMFLIAEPLRLEKDLVVPFLPFARNTFFWDLLPLLRNIAILFVKFLLLLIYVRLCQDSFFYNP